MMTARSKSTNSKTAPERPPSRIPPGPERREKTRITAAYRWLLISKNVYGRAQQRGFVGGNPLEDLSEAAQEIDETYATDVPGLLALTDPVELVEQFRSLFAGYGLGEAALDKLLEMNEEALEKLAESNRRLQNGQAERAARRSSLLQDATDEAVKLLQSIGNSTLHLDAMPHLVEQPARAVKDTLARLRQLGGSAEEISAASESDGSEEESPAPGGMGIHGAVVKAYAGLTAKDLAEAPVAALRGVSPASSDKLKSTLRMKSIRDMADSRLRERAEGVVTLADSEKDAAVAPRRSAGKKRASTLADIADGPVERLEGVTRRQANALEEALHIKTVRDLADNRFLRVARAIVTLAELED